MDTTETTTIVWPLRDNVIRGNKYHHTFGSGKGFELRHSKCHWGWDFAAKVQTPCYAIADGKIERIYGNSHDTESFGLVVVLEFQYENQTLYAAYCHLNSSTVSENATVKAGQLIGYTGKSGNARTLASREDHLHFELRTAPKPSRGGPPKRISPIRVFKVCPQKQSVYQPPVGQATVE